MSTFVSVTQYVIIASQSLNQFFVVVSLCKIKVSLLYTHLLRILRINNITFVNTNGIIKRSNIAITLKLFIFLNIHKDRNSIFQMEEVCKVP